MAFSINYLNRSTAGEAVGGTQIWTYKSTDNLATTIAADYFLDAYRKLTVGDLMWIVATNGFAFYTVTTSSSAGVTITALPAPA